MTIREILAMAWKRSGREPGPRERDRGYNWICVCPVCCEIRKLGRLPR